MPVRTILIAAGVFLGRDSDGVRRAELNAREVPLYRLDGCDRATRQLARHTSSRVSRGLASSRAVTMASRLPQVAVSLDGPIRSLSASSSQAEA
jgi:hypothetical protein